MTEQYPQGIWDASEYFEHLTATNRLAKSERFTFCHVSGLDGFEEALAHMQRTTAFVCVSDIANGFTELNNTPHTRRVKTVFLAKRHKIDDMAARTRCMETLRELFRQYMSLLILEKTKLEQHCICLDPRTAFRKRQRRWFSRKYYASVMRLKEFYKENIGEAFAGIMSDFARRCNKKS